MPQHFTFHLPLSLEECHERGWEDGVDIVLVTGDAYIDHPSFGVALIGRLLESHGYRVAIISQPRHDRTDDFYRFGRPRLFFGITAGNLDSIVANYSGNGKVRNSDNYSRDGNPWHSEPRNRTNRRRPDRATIVYANLARAAYKDIPIILGGIEASLRRFIHFDYKQNQLRGSVLTDGKADLLIYGMGERAITAAAENIAAGKRLSSIPGSCERLTEHQFEEMKILHGEQHLTFLPSWLDIQKDQGRFLEAEMIIDKSIRCLKTHVVQQQKSGWIIQHPAAPPLTSSELDGLYNLPFTRKPHPREGEIPAYGMIRHSITIVRGCSGNCSFCAITRHQGPQVFSRSSDSIIKEAHRITQMDDFSGTISDLGGPTANLYGTSCRRGGCDRYDCLFPKVCKHLEIDESVMITLLDEIASLQNVKHVFISSGLRMELLLKTPRLLEKLITSHMPGSLKIAPEHTEAEILRLMHKESHEILQKFVKKCREVAGHHLTIHFTPYVITGHPGSTVESAEALVRKLEKLDLQAKQFQDFTPTPGTIATAMFVSGKDTRGKNIHIPSPGEKVHQRAILERAFHKRMRSKRIKGGKTR